MVRLGRIGKVPVFGAKGFEVGGVVCVARGVVDSREVKGFAAFDAGAATPAVKLAALVAGPGLFKRDAQFGAAAGDIGFAPIDKGAAEANFFPIAEPDRGCHSVGKFGAAVWVNGMIAVVGGIGDFGGAAAESITGGKGKEEHVAVWNHGGFHACFGVMPLGDGNIGGGEAASGEERANGGEVGALKGNLELSADGCRLFEFAGVALSVIDGEGLHGMARI